MNHHQGTKLVQMHDGELRVASDVMAERSGNQHKNVMELIRKNLVDFEVFGGVAFETRPFQTAGGVQRREVAHLNEQQATLLITYLRNTDTVRALKVALVKDFYEMRAALAQNAPALTEDQIVHQALQITAKKVQELELRIAADAHKVNYHDTFVANEDNAKFRTIASDLDMKESDLRDFLIKRGWIYVEERTRFSHTKGKKELVRRYSEYAHKKGYFYRELNHDAPRFGGEVMHTLKITPEGAEAIARLVKRHGEPTQMEMSIEEEAA